jgi:uncharacterized damage-inducible protein DinB
MSIDLKLETLLDYSDWERQKMHDRLNKEGPAVLKLSAGPNGDSRFQCVGDLIRHIFSAEKRYVERLAGLAMTDTSTLPNDNLEVLFQFGQQSRKDFREFLANFPRDQWDLPQDQKLGNSVLTLTPRKIVTHIALHEIRHWAQITTMLRMNGIKDDFHDFLFSPALGGSIRRERASTSAPRGN